MKSMRGRQWHFSLYPSSSPTDLSNFLIQIPMFSVITFRILPPCRSVIKWVQAFCGACKEIFLESRKTPESSSYLNHCINIAECPLRLSAYKVVQPPKFASPNLMYVLKPLAIAILVSRCGVVRLALGRVTSQMKAHTHVTTEFFNAIYLHGI